MDNSNDVLSAIISATPPPSIAEVGNAEQTSAQGNRLPMQATNARLRVAQQPVVIAAGASIVVNFDNADPELVTVIATPTPVVTLALGSLGNTVVSVGAPSARFTMKRNDTIIVVNPTADDLTVSVLAHDPAFVLEF